MNDIDIKVCLNKIVNSKDFALSGVYKKLLEYLTEATLRGDKPKEFTIGHEVFSQNIEDVGTSRVRVAVYKLRKRLDKYYKGDGASDDIRFSIPKGGYSLEFTQNKGVSYKKTIIGFAIIITLLLLFLGVWFFIIQKTDYYKLGNTTFWNELANNNKETIIIAGDFFMYNDLKYEREYGRIVNVRDVYINTEKQLQEYLHNTSNMKQEDYLILRDVAYMPRDALFSMQYLFPLLYENKIKYKIILSSDFNWETYKNYNLIYIGAFKNLNSLSILIDKLKIKYNNDSTNSFRINDDEKEANLYVSTFLSSKNIDYTVVAKIPGSYNNVIHMFISDNDIGCIEAVKYFTQLELVNNFEKRFLDGDSFFKSVYKAEGISRTGLSFELLEYEPLTDSTVINFWHY